MIKPDVIMRSFKIGNDWLFDRETSIGYRVIWENGDIANFEECYKIVENGENGYDCIASSTIPSGVIRKSIFIKEMNE